LTRLTHFSDRNNDETTRSLPRHSRPSSLLPAWRAWASVTKRVPVMGPDTFTRDPREPSSSTTTKWQEAVNSPLGTGNQSAVTAEWRTSASVPPSRSGVQRSHSTVQGTYYDRLLQSRLMILISLLVGRTPGSTCGHVQPTVSGARRSRSGGATWLLFPVPMVFQEPIDAVSPSIHSVTATQGIGCIEPTVRIRTKRLSARVPRSTNHPQQRAVPGHGLDLHLAVMLRKW
jgi:hypothetical protein